MGSWCLRHAVCGPVWAAAGWLPRGEQGLTGWAQSCECPGLCRGIGAGRLQSAPARTTTRALAKVRLRTPAGAHHQLGCPEHPGSSHYPALGEAVHIVVYGVGLQTGSSDTETNVSNAPWRCAAGT